MEQLGKKHDENFTLFNDFGILFATNFSGWYADICP